MASIPLIGSNSIEALFRSGLLDGFGCVVCSPAGCAGVCRLEVSAGRIRVFTDSGNELGQTTRFAERFLAFSHLPLDPTSNSNAASPEFVAVGVGHIPSSDTHIFLPRDKYDSLASSFRDYLGTNAPAEGSGVATPLATELPSTVETLGILTCAWTFAAIVLLTVCRTRGRART